MEDKFDKAYILELADKVKNGTITDQEWQYYNRWYNSLSVDLLELSPDQPDPLAIRDRMHRRILDEALKDKVTERSVYRFPLKWVALAASLLLAAFIIFYLQNKWNVEPLVPNKTVINVAPGSDKATLTLADGKKISLTEASAGIIAKENGINISKDNDGTIVYSGNADASAAKNLIEIPIGGQYKIVLPDGSRVWLNASSSLRYPASFVGMKERKVELSGEAYFEVSPDKRKPFIVATSSQEVKVLGTHFNVNSYTDESAVTTTLLEGKVAVHAYARSKISKDVVLFPGQQSVTRDGSVKTVQADIEAVVAWKNGLFKFSDANIESIMRQVSRWYAVDVKYNGNVPKNLFSGGIERNVQLNTLLKIFEASGMKFRVVESGDKKTLIVNP
jgi:transmembrane sensor